MELIILLQALYGYFLRVGNECWPTLLMNFKATLPVKKEFRARTYIMIKSPVYTGNYPEKL